MKRDFDLIVIGAGAAGIAAACTAASMGKKVAVVEQNKLGGAALWSGSVPRMALCQAGMHAYKARQLPRYGVHVGSSLLQASSVMSVVRDRIQAVYATYIDKLAALDVAVLYGTARFINKRTITLDGNPWTAKKYIIATGSVRSLPEIEGLLTVPLLTDQTLWDIDKLPASMIIVGASTAGVEYAHALSNLGVKVTLVDVHTRILPYEDTEISDYITKLLVKDGVVVQSATRVIRVEQDGHGVRMVCAPAADREASMTFVVRADYVFVQSDRAACVHDLGLETTGISFGEPGVHVNDYLRTSVRSLYACGSVLGTPEYCAEQQGSSAAHNACCSRWSRRVYDASCSAHMTMVGLECVSYGLTELQVHKKYDRGVTVYRAASHESERGLIEQSQGFVKVMCDKKGTIVGAHIIGERAGELAQTLMRTSGKLKMHNEAHGRLHGYLSHLDILNRLSKRP